MKMTIEEARREIMPEKKDKKWVEIQASDYDTHLLVQQFLWSEGFKVVGAGINRETGVSDLRMQIRMEK